MGRARIAARRTSPPPPAILIPCTSLSPEELPCSSFHSLLPRAQAELSRPVAAPAISGRRSSIPPTSICRASSSTHPRAHLSCSPTEIDSPRPPPLETLPHASSSILRPFSARPELGVSITASPSTSPAISCSIPGVARMPWQRPAETGTAGFRNRNFRFWPDKCLKPEPPVLSGLHI